MNKTIESETVSKTKNVTKVEPKKKSEWNVASIIIFTILIISFALLILFFISVAIYGIINNNRTDTCADTDTDTAIDNDNSDPADEPRNLADQNIIDKINQSTEKLVNKILGKKYPIS